MPRYIIQLKDQFLEWSTIVDAPVTWGMTFNDFFEYYRNQYGMEGLRGLPERMRRVYEKGTSEMGASDLMDTIGYNRAGPKESRLTPDQLYQNYCVD